MSIERILQKEAPQPGTFTGLSGAGLGSPEAEYEHWELINDVSTSINIHLRNSKPNFIAGTEAVSDRSVKKGYKVYDIGIKIRKDKKGPNIVLIEVCHNETLENAVDRIMKNFSSAKPVKEAFLFNYSDHTLRYYKPGVTGYTNNSICQEFNFDLDIFIKSYYSR
ncbi:MAG: hypothetical protein MJZ11_13990 [Lachnospiraceae bacterium]|nr:hypothetical protein [Lachnospiraceae bacterium]